MEDLQIVELFWNRDEMAIEEVNKKYNPFCFKVAWNILHNREDSEECVNDTWYSAWKYIPPQKPAILSCFLGKITRGFAIDLLRKKYAAKRADLHMNHSLYEFTQEISILNHAVSDSLDEYLEEQELYRLLNIFLQGLKDTDRDIFLRRYWHMDSIADIAKRHQLSESSIKSNLFRSRNKLKKLLEKERYSI